MATVSTTEGTYLTNLFDPKVIGDRINKKLYDFIRFAPLARQYTNLVGRPGSTIVLPYYAALGAATVVPEGTDIPIAQLVEHTMEITIKKFGRGAQITDEAVLSAYGDPIGELVDQLAQAIAQGVDNDMLAIMGSQADASMTTDAAALSADGVAEALTLFGEDIDGDKVLITTPLGYQALRLTKNWIPNTEVGAQMVIRGTVGMVHGCQVVVSNKLVATDCSYIVKPGALAQYTKRDILVETDRDIINKSTVLTADKHFVNALIDKSKLIKMPGAGSST